MSKGLLFWILMLLWAIFAIAPLWGGGWIPIGGSLLLFVLLALLGWKLFGPPIQG